MLECVNRLLDKGYRPENIELERTWTLGHEQKSGRADICVSNQNGKMLFIVECKTFGVEYNKEMKNILSDGGQLISYWCLYYFGGNCGYWLCRQFALQEYE